MTSTFISSDRTLRFTTCVVCSIAIFVISLTIHHAESSSIASSPTDIEHAPNVDGEICKEKFPTAEQSVCQSDYFRAKCSGADEVLIVTNALYGRMRMSKCVKENFGYVGCKNDVIDVMHNHCSGRRECSIRVLDENFVTTKPCHDDLKSYLQVNYHCVKVISADKTDCQAHRPLIVTNRTGYLASLTAVESGCGTSDSPWYIEALPGQRINITLFDFTPHDIGVQQVQSRQIGGSSSLGLSSGGVSAVVSVGNGGQMCRVYATIREVNSKRSATVCGGGAARQKSVHVSTDHQVEIRIISSHNSPKPVIFVLQYEAVGCRELQEPIGGWAKHEADEMIFGCYDDTGETWRLVCHGSTWIGDQRNCTSALIETSTDGIAAAVSFPLGLSIAIIITLAVAIWLAILAVGIVCLKSMRGGSGSRQQCPLSADLSVDVRATPNDIYSYRDAADHYRTVTALNLNDLRRLQPQPDVAVGNGGGGTTNGCVSCSSNGAKQQTVVCTVRNTRTATLVHRVQPNGSGGVSANGGSLHRGEDDVYQSRDGVIDEIYCHSPYCIYARTVNPFRSSSSFKRNVPASGVLANGPDVAIYQPTSKRHLSGTDDSTDKDLDRWDSPSLSNNLSTLSPSEHNRSNSLLIAQGAPSRQNVDVFGHSDLDLGQGEGNVNDCVGISIRSELNRFKTAPTPPPRLDIPDIHQQGSAKQ